ncbi:unnamed protein product [Ceutorhynchus assimilis]|uniref:Uncharacterized protein n=1 Tax=Ceutorhynchus assimilis TaxID=467358 RepID=A0A9N9QM21_9CUCU|nr:unnamed protein product [Ceutorhynchus assimilis]
MYFCENYCSCDVRPKIIKESGYRFIEYANASIQETTRDVECYVNCPAPCQEKNVVKACSMNKTCKVKKRNAKCSCNKPPICIKKKPKCLCIETLKGIELVPCQNRTNATKNICLIDRVRNLLGKNKKVDVPKTKIYHNKCSCSVQTTKSICLCPKTNKSPATKKYNEVPCKCPPEYTLCMCPKKPTKKKTICGYQSKKKSSKVKDNYEVDANITVVEPIRPKKKRPSADKRVSLNGDSKLNELYESSHDARETSNVIKPIQIN